MYVGVQDRAFNPPSSSGAYVLGTQNGHNVPFLESASLNKKEKKGNENNQIVRQMYLWLSVRKACLPVVYTDHSSLGLNTLYSSGSRCVTKWAVR